MDMSMGTLKPGATLIYERVGDEVYAREFGETERTLVGYNQKYDPRTPDGRALHEHILEDKLWGNIRRAARTNPALQDALDRAIMIYNLSKTHD
jgi:hypothetical protein